MAENQAEQNGNNSSEKGRSNNRNNRSNQNRSHNNRGSGNRDRGTKQHHNVDMRKYDRMISAAISNFSDIPCGPDTQECEICYKPNDVFGIGACRHPICAECAIRIRVIGESKGCPVCRTESDLILFCTTGQDFSTIPIDFNQTGHPDESRFGVRFSNEVAGKKYEKYLAHVCKICKGHDEDRLEFPSFIALRQHMANNHELSYCHICTDNLNLFSRERKSYTRDQLQRHIRIGDFDDKSFKGHPKCLFCELRFLDDDNRYRHLRKDHFFCQFCESDASKANSFFGKHDELKKHYKENHFSCQLSECVEMGIAFATEMELNLHRANEHSSGKRNVIDVGFQRRGFNLGGQSSSTGSGGGRGRGNGRAQTADSTQPASSAKERIAVVQRPEQEANNPQSDPSQFTVVPSAQSRSLTTRYANHRPAYTPQVQDFPSLAPQPPPPPVLKSNDFPRLKKQNKQTNQPATPVEDFPSLGSTSTSTQSNRISVPQLPKRSVPQPKKAPIQQKPKTASHGGGGGNRNNNRDEEELDYIPRRDVPQAVIKVNNSLLRFDMEDNRATPVAKSNIQLIPRNDVQPQQQQPTRSQGNVSASSRMDFPSLPTPSAPIVPANSAWMNSKNSKVKGAITGVTVPTNYSNATKNVQKNKKKVKVPVNDVWSNMGRPTTPPEMKKNDEDEWKDVPLTKEELIEKAKKEKREEWARKKAENQSTQKKETVVEPKIVKEQKEEIVVQETPKKEETWQEVTKGIEPPVSSSNKKNKKAKDKNNKKVEEEKEEETNQKIEKQKEEKVETERVEERKAIEVAEENLQQKIDAIWNMPALPSMTSMTSILSHFSFTNMFGGGSPSQSTVSTPTTTTNSPLLPPPGLENVIARPPPGLNNSQQSEQISFASVPYVSHQDAQKARNNGNVVNKVTEDDWISTKNATKNKKKK